MTYEYLDTVTGKTHEAEQRITDEAFTHYSPSLESWGGPGFQRTFRPPQWHPVKRLISGAPAVQFISGPSGGWARDGYALTEPQRKAEAKLGRKVTRRA